MVIKYNIIDIEGNITHEGISIDEVNEILEGWQKSTCILER